MEFQTLGEKERVILLTALDYDINNLLCFYCGEDVNYKDCCIMPPINKEDENARITCNSPLCVTEYLEDLEEDKLELTEETKEKLIQAIKSVEEGKVMSFDEMMERLKRTTKEHKR
jgi:hypothetical protein